MKRLKQLREAKNMTQIRLSIELGVSQETISGYENGKATPPADMLVKIADILDTSVDYLLERTMDKQFNKINKSDLTEQELELITYYRKMPQNKKERVVGFMIGLLELI
jgi:transcriptional regulator with XRE-family HTH domain